MIDLVYADVMTGAALAAAEAGDLCLVVADVGLLVDELASAGWPEVDELDRWHRLIVAADERRVMLSSRARLAGTVAALLAAVRARLDQVADDRDVTADLRHAMSGKVA